MQFKLFSLVLLCLLAACFMAFHHHNVVWSLCLSSFCVSAYSLNAPGRVKGTSLKQLMMTGSAAAVTAMLSFGLVTIAVYWADLAMEGSLPAPEEFEIGYGKYLLLFVLIYGGCAAIGGALLGLLVYGSGILLDGLEVLTNQSKR
ncbi:hypothetical protein SAMN06265222_11940 [Neorhodopirellula lusitana]|uniref:Transmembrane protein n=1 Tax=Neorhodopirellula lusitana TaxID=445327 RepID=A0ABY1QMX3_9BACT|nr:hypothetical protein [Neorhodopirellula lusitana]SMP75449.1 hypothetical protein SAMN06265222_11940 [Neorhodopirellula lusitana]